MKKKPNLRSEVAIQKVIDIWKKLGESPVLYFHNSRMISRNGDEKTFGKLLAILDLREVIAKRKNLKGIQAKLMKAVRSSGKKKAKKK